MSKKEVAKVKSEIVMKESITVPVSPKQYYDWAKEYVEIIGKQMATFNVKIRVYREYHLPKALMQVKDPSDKTGKTIMMQPDLQLIDYINNEIKTIEEQMAEFNWTYARALEYIKDYETSQKKTE